MKFAKFTAYDESPIYINVMNVNAIYQTDLTGLLTCIDMIGQGNEQGTYFVVKEPIEEVRRVLENENS